LLHQFCRKNQAGELVGVGALGITWEEFRKAFVFRDWKVSWKERVPEDHAKRKSSVKLKIVTCPGAFKRLINYQNVDFEGFTGLLTA